MEIMRHKPETCMDLENDLDFDRITTSNTDAWEPRVPVFYPRWQPNSNHCVMTLHIRFRKEVRRIQTYQH